jgi:methylmalonyl-CoA mutase
VTNLLAAGGLSATDAGSPVAILAASAAGYAEHGAAVIEELRAAGAQCVLVAGRAIELGDDAHLVDGEVYDGIDVVAVLDDLLDRLGAPADPPGTIDETEGTR